MRGQVQPSAGQPNTTQPSTQTPQPATGALGRVGAGGPDGLIAVPYTSKDSLLVIMISVCVIVGVAGLILATVFWVSVSLVFLVPVFILRPPPPLHTRIPIWISLHLLTETLSTPFLSSPAISH
uniref:Uncharacterized protein n=1 Tax=Hucho hucho TaxID=62062 RepID=A0A4W5M946_9TELE